MDNRLRGKEAAIRVLEAAGKVDKKDALHTLCLLAAEWYSTSGEYGEGSDSEANKAMKPSVDMILSFLETLPDRAEDSLAYQSVFGSKPGKEE
jgi:hypothetical protein